MNNALFELSLGLSSHPRKDWPAEEIDVIS
jgi:hypothetical protein